VLRRFGVLLAVLLLIAGAGVVYGPGRLLDVMRGERFVKCELLRSQRTFPMTHLGEVMVLADNNTELQNHWSAFGLSGPRPEIDWQRSIVLLVGTGEAGTCPLSFEGLSLNRETHLLTVHVRIRGSKFRRRLICTADWSPRTFVISMPRRSLPTGALSGRIKEHLFLVDSRTSPNTVLQQPPES